MPMHCAACPLPPKHMNTPSGSAKRDTVEVCPDALLLKSKRDFGGFEYHDCSPVNPAAPPVAVSVYVTLYSLALAEPRIWPNDGLPELGAPLAAPPVDVAA